MRTAGRIITGLAVAALTAVGLGFGLRLYLDRAAENRLRPGEAVASIAALHSPLPQNSFLACPVGYCPAAKAAVSPVFAMPWPQLRERWLAMIAEDSRIVRLDSGGELRRLVYIQHTPILRFPDIVTVEFVDLGPERSSLAIYSRSRYGRGDFGRNRERVERWLTQLRRSAAAAR